MIDKIANYPIEIVQRMMFHQQNQGNPADVNIFRIKGPDTNKSNGGFDWTKTFSFGEGSDFWSKIFNKRDFAYFFKMHPEIPRSGTIFLDTYKKEEEKEEAAPQTKDMEIEMEGIPVGTEVYVTEDSGIRLKRRLLSYNEDFALPVIVITEKAYQQLLNGEGDGQRIRAFSAYETIPEEEVIELTLTDISNGKGVGVPPHLIKII